MPTKNPVLLAAQREREKEKRRAGIYKDPNHKNRQRAYRTRNEAYQQREYQRQNKEWSIGAMWLLTADGEADNSGNYDQFSVYDGVEFHDLQRPGRSIAFGEMCQFLRQIFYQHKKQDKTRRANVYHFFSYHYDIDIALSHDPLLTEDEKQALARQRSNSYGVEQPEGWEREIELPALGLAVYIGRKETTIRYLKIRNGEIVRDENGKAITTLTIKLVDTYTLTAMPFLKTIKPLRNVLSPEELVQFDKMYELIERGKAERGEWSEEFTYEKRQEYNHAELQTMWWWLKHIIDGCKAIGLAPRSLAGPAPFARALIYKYGLQSHVQPENYNDVESQHGEAVRWQKRAYYGARIEMCGQGVVPVHTELDQTSGYPFNLANMPCYAHGHWKHVVEPGVIHDDSIYYLSWKPQSKNTPRYGPLPVRKASGTIYYPIRGEGYYYGCEVRAILPYWNVHIADSLIWVSECEHTNPFREMVNEMFALRARKIAEGDDSAALVIKLSLNSLYGIFAQSAGAARIVDENKQLIRYKLPKFYNLAAAGYITAGTRARMYEVAQTIGEDRVLGFATDALFIDGELEPATAELLDVTDDMHKRLGALTMEVHADPTAFIAPGVRASASGKIKKSRGYPHAFTLDEICEYWRNGEEYIIQTRKRYVDIRMTPHDTSKRGTFVQSTRLAAINSGVLYAKRDIPDRYVPRPDRFTVYPPYKRMMGPNIPYARRFEKSAALLAKLDNLAKERDYYE